MLGFRLPARYDEWVFRDLTAPRWWLRITLRVTLIPFPLAIGCLFLPGDLGLRLMTASFFVWGPAFLGAAYADEFRAYRLRQHGLLPPSGPDPEGY